MAKTEPLKDPTAFVDLLEKSGLLPSDAVSAVRQSAQGQTDAAALARQLVKDGKLTKWQSYQLLLGTSRLTVAKYQLLDQIGKGPLGRVYLAEHGKLGKKVSLKVLSARFSSQPDVLKQFLEDANRAGALNHRNIVHVFDAGNENDRYYLVVEYVEGKDLQRLVEAGGPLPAAKAIELARQAAEGLAHAHEQNLTHGDLKPSNLLVDASGVVKIMDLGLSRLADHSTPMNGEESTEAASLASLAFRAPELLAGNRSSDVRSDLYSLGAVLHFLLTGKPPSRDEDKAAANLERAPGVSAELSNLCDHLLATDPQERPESAAQVAAALELAGRAVLSPEKIEKTADRPVSERPSSAGKPKRPLVAKALEEAAAPIVITGAGDAADSDSDPLAGFSIKTGRKRKVASQPAATAATDAPAGAKATTAPVSTKQASRLPLILTAAIGGGVLVLAAMATIVLLVLNRGGSQEVASAGKDVAAAKSSSAPAVTSAEQSKGEEANPEANPEFNPESNPSPILKTNSAVAPGAQQNTPPRVETKTPEAQGAVSASGDQPAAPPKPAEGPTPMPAATPATTDSKPPEPMPSETKTASEPDKTAATTPAPTPPPAPAANPFQGFAPTVALPELEAMGKPAPDALSPIVLGPVNVGPTARCGIQLKGGESAYRGKTKFLLDRAEQGTAERDWEFKFQNDSDPPIVIATMSLKEDQLSFQWTEPATTEQAAPYLRNCLLTMTAGTGTHQVALRKPDEVDPLATEIEKGAINEKFNLAYPPSGKRITVEIGPLEGGPAKHKVDPKTELEAFKDSTYLLAGNADDALLLGFKIDVSMPGKTLEIVAQPQFKLGGMLKPERYLKNTPNQLTNVAAKGIQEATFKGQLATKIPNKDAKKKAEDHFKAQLELAQKGMAQVEQLKEIAKLLQDGGRLHFRAYYLADDGARVDLIHTGGPPAAPPMPKPEAK